jgi:catechol 2,3-dioxygenase-like lactoylglutathione lyase family enzyme
MTVLGIHHVQLAMPRGEEEKARAFYSGVLGFTEVKKPANLAKEGGVWFRSHAAEIHLGVDPEFRAARKAHPALIVENLSRIAEKCAAAGYAVTSGEPLAGYERLYVADPFGNRVELLEPSKRDKQQKAKAGF